MRPCLCQAGPSSRSLKATLWACSRAERRLGWAVARVVLKELAMGSLLWSLRAQFLGVTQRETEAQRFFGELLRGLRTRERNNPQHFLSIIPRPGLTGLVLAEPLLLTSPRLSVSPAPSHPPPHQATAAPRLPAQEPQSLLSKQSQRCCLGTNSHWPDLPLSFLQGLLSRGCCSLEMGVG